MGKSREKDISQVSRRLKPALSPEARENQMISLAVDLAEKQLIEGTASAQVITHYLKLATMKEQLERGVIIMSIEKMKLMKMKLMDCVNAQMENLK